MIALNEIPITSNGIYFLIQDSRIVYIGQSTNLICRISDHIRSNKVFNQVFYYKTESYTDQERIKLESILIHRFRPMYNISCNHEWFPDLNISKSIQALEKMIPEDLLEHINTLNSHDWNQQQSIKSMQKRQKNKNFRNHKMQYDSLADEQKAEVLESIFKRKEIKNGSK